MDSPMDIFAPYIVSENPHDRIDGIVRIYVIGNRLFSAINGTQAHPYPYAWEILEITDGIDHEEYVFVSESEAAFFLLRIIVAELN